MALGRVELRAFSAWVLLAMAMAIGCARPTADSPRIGYSPLAGKELIYQFPSGRTYSATYHETAVSFVLLEPSQAEPPSAIMRYAWVELRDDLTLIVWDHPQFGATFVVDLGRRELHASSVREGGRRFLGRAEILEVRPARDPAEPGSP